MSKVKVTTLSEIHGGVELEVLGPVLVNVVRATHGGKDIIAKVKDLFGGRVGAIENLISAAQKDALDEAREEVLRQQGNALIDLKFEYSTIGDKGGLLGVHLMASAARIKEDNSVSVTQKQDLSSESHRPKQLEPESSGKIKFGELHGQQQPQSTMLGDFNKR